MAVSWACGFEVYAPLATYTGAGWSASGTVDPRDSFDWHQHPSGVGGGKFCARLDAASAFRFNALNITSGGGCTLSVFSIGNWSTAGSEMWAVRDSANRVIVGVKPSSAGSTTSTMNVLHNGVVVATIPNVTNDGQHHWWGATWEYVSGNVVIKVWYDNVLRATATTALTTNTTATQFAMYACTDNRVSYDHIVTYDSPNDDASLPTWVQGLRPRSVYNTGTFTPQGGATDIATALADLSDATYAQTASASAMACYMQRRSDIGDAWQNFDVLAVTSWGAGQGDGAQPRGQVYTTVATATDAGGASVLQSAAPNISTTLPLLEPPGIPASPSLDFSWKSTHIDLLMLSYRTGV